GILEQLVHEITIECLPSDIPHQINLDITNLKINESYHIKDIPQNEKIRILSPQDMVLVVITTPGKEEVEKPKEELATQAQAEPEIVGKKGKAETPIEGAAETKETKEAKPAKETKKK
ncbi:MAG: 50S ribosomal protein L25, partial [Candidatus Firestonebacteria bacterium]|nr:50S ribosomal protein L25 [Candidatus Firestonebacteria bacterium]